ncbi:MAG: MMPL family transporter [Bifidobacteriaceae bacterium]|jgi:RND superfamily putative drug exporter|nr:MMPL family transporter [Bifidobacteriaceae bacterium]
MAEFLYRLGKAAAKRAWVVIASWAGLLGLAAVAYAAGHGGLAASFDIPGLPSSEVVEELGRELPDYAGASGTVVLRTVDGQPFSQDQRDQVAAAVAGAADLPDVAQAVDPFAAESERQAQADQLAAGRTQLESARQELDQGEAQLAAAAAELDRGEAQLEAAAAELDQGQAQLDQALAAAGPAGAASPELQARQAAIDAGRAAIQAQRETLTQGRAELDTRQAAAQAGRAELDEQETQLSEAETLIALAAPIKVVSADGDAALVQLAFTEPRMDLSSQSKRAAIAHFEDAGIEDVEVAASVELSQDVPDVLGWGEAAGLALAALVLVVMFRALIPTAVPVIGAVTGVGVATLTALAFSSAVVMTSVTPILGVMLGLAVGVDYSLFIVNRHRRQLRAGMAPLESLALANGTSGTAVVFAGATVVVALAALGVTGVPFLGLMGLVGAAAVAVAVVVAVTLTPAILGLAGRRVLPRSERDAGPRPPAPDAGAPKTVASVVRALAAAAVLATLALPALDLRLGLPDGSSEPAGSLAERADAITAAEFGPGANGPLLVAAQLPKDLDDAALLDAQVAVATVLADQADVDGVAPVAVSESGRLAAFQVLATGGPNDRSTAALVDRLRGLASPVDGQAFGVAGQAAINIDISERLEDVLPLYLTLVVGLTLLILILVFRSLVVPLIAAGGFILSLFATLGAVVAIFQWGWAKDLIGLNATGPVLNFLPVILAGVLFGLAMDYQIFLAAGMREAYVHGSAARVAVASGFKAGRAVVTAAGLIMVAIFGAFGLADSPMVKSVGLGLALGVVADAFIVRLVLMPALMALVGRAAWWLPRWLDRILPQVDIEGAALAGRHALAADGGQTASRP